MLTPEYLETFADSYMKKVDKLNETITKDIARRIAKTGTITGTAEWQAKMVQHSNKLYNDVIKDVSKFTGESEKDIAKMFADAGVQCMKNDAEPLLKAGALKDAKLSETAQQLLVANATKCQKDINNLTLTTAVSTQNEFKEALNQAFLKVQSGAFSYTQAIMDAVAQLSTLGPTVQYASGYVGSLEAGVRTALMTAINQTASRITEMNAETLGAEYYEVSAHEGARPEHQVWQGKVFKIRGSEPGYPNFYEATGYGTGKGLGGYNCRHSFYPYFPKYSKRNWTDEQLEALNNKSYEINGKKYTAYNYNQTKRRLQRTIKANNRKLTALRQLKKSGLSNVDLSNEINRLGNTIKNQRKELQYFSIVKGEIQTPQKTRLEEYYYNLLSKMKGFDKLPEKYRKDITKALAKAPNEIKEIWKKYAEKLELESLNEEGRNYFSRGKVYLDIVHESDAEDACETFFHEFGHNIDYLLSKGGKLDTNRSGLIAKLRSEARENILNNYLLTLSNSAQDLYFNDDSEREFGSVKEAIKVLKIEAESQTNFLVKNGIIKESEREINFSLMYADSLDKELDFRSLSLDYYEYVKNKNTINKNYQDISDMYEAAFGGIVSFPFGWGHGNSNSGYWDDDYAISTEAIAEMFSATAMQNGSLELIKEHFPKSYDMFISIIKEGGEL